MLCYDATETVTPTSSILWAEDGPPIFCTCSQPLHRLSVLTKTLRRKPSPGESFHWKVLLLNSAELQFHQECCKSAFRDWTATSLYSVIFPKCWMVYVNHQERGFLVGSREELQEHLPDPWFTRASWAPTGSPVSTVGTSSARTYTHTTTIPIKLLLGQSWFPPGLF